MTESIEFLKIEASAKLKWLNFEIRKPLQKETGHPLILQNLSRISDKIVEFIRLIDINSTLPNNDLAKEIIRKSKNLVSDLDRAAAYISALQRERNEDRLIRSLILDTIQKYGISIDDLLVSLNSQFSSTTYEPAPLITGYPWSAFTLTDSAAFFHEIGHIVFFKYSDIQYLMDEVVEDFFLQYEKKNSGTNNRRNEEIKKITKNGKTYWDEYRLNELFADIYASYISGPIFYENVINMVLKDENSQFDLKDIDPHPPSGVRAQVCNMVSSDHWRGNREFILLNDIFKEFQSNIRIPYETRVICSPDLMSELVKTTTKFIANKVSGTIRFEPAQLEGGESSGKISYFIRILYKGLDIKLRDSKSYISWEKKAIKDMIRFVNNS